MTLDVPVDLYTLLQHVRQRPSMFLRDLSLEELETTCYGYSEALTTHGIVEFGIRFNERFRDFLSERYNWDICLGWAWAICERSTSDEEVRTPLF